MEDWRARRHEAYLEHLVRLQQSSTHKNPADGIVSHSNECSNCRDGRMSLQHWMWQSLADMIAYIQMRHTAKTVSGLHSTKTAVMQNMLFYMLSIPTSFPTGACSGLF